MAGDDGGQGAMRGGDDRGAEVSMGGLDLKVEWAGLWRRGGRREEGREGG